MVGSSVRQSADLIAVIAFAVTVCSVILWSPFHDSVPVTILALPLVLFLPGYALLAAVFPRAGVSPVDESAERPDAGVEYYRDRGIDVTERVVLAIVLSVLVTPLLGLAIDASPYGVRRVPVAITLTATTVLLAIAGVARRVSIPTAERFDIGPFVTRIRRRFSTASRGVIALNALIVVCLLVAVAGGAFATDRADEGERFTEFYLLSETDDGDLMNEAPDRFVSGQATGINIGVSNLEGTSETYTVVVRLERVDHRSGRVVESETLDRYEIGLEHGEESVDERRIRPSIEGERLRLAVLLYVDDPPEEPTAENAYRDVYAWVDVVRP